MYTACLWVNSAKDVFLRTLRGTVSNYETKQACCLVEKSMFTSTKMKKIHQYSISSLFLCIFLFFLKTGFRWIFRQRASCHLLRCFTPHLIVDMSISISVFGPELRHLSAPLERDAQGTASH